MSQIPVRPSVYQILIETLKVAGRKTFIHRFIYAGQHKNDTATEALFTKIIGEINNTYVDERLTGLLLLYANHFMHIIDGSENAIMQHLFRIWENEEFCEGSIKVLTIYHHINQRMFDQWACRRAKPPILLEKINPACDYNDMKHYLEMCIKKIYNLAIALRMEVEDFEGSEKNRHSIGEILSTHSQFLPEYNLLDFILNNSDILNLSVLKSIYILTDSDQTYDTDCVWPVRSDFIPYNIFDKEYNPVPYLFPPKKH